MITFASKLAPDSGIIDQTTYMFTSFATVLLVLIVMAAATAVIGMLFAWSDKAKNKKSAVATAAAPAAPLPGSASSANVAAIIGSAVHATLEGAPHRIVSVRSSDGSAGTISGETAAVISAAVFTALASPSATLTRAPIDFGWAQSGRNAIFASKNPKK